MRSRWCICGKRIREDDDVCSDACERELERRAEEAGGEPMKCVVPWEAETVPIIEHEPEHEPVVPADFPRRSEVSNQDPIGEENR
jgi:hypothetical protein